MPKTSPKAAIKPAAVKAPAKGDHVFLVDGSSYIFRAYHALPPLNRKSDGLQVNAVLGFCNMLWKLLRDMPPDNRPTHLAIVFDKSEITFRNKLYPDYKAHRPPAPDDLIPQFALIREAVRAFDLPCLEQGGFEADDLIATYAREAGERGATTTIVSSDKDLMQLVTDKVTMYDTMKDRRIGIPEVIEKFGVPPEKVVEVQALIGDSTDNVPGVPGVGPKAAGTLISVLGSLDRILSAEKNPEIIENELKTKLAELDEQIASIAGKPIKPGSAAEVGKVLSEKFGEKDLAKDKKGNPTADTETIGRLADSGNKFCKLILEARDLSRVIGGTVSKIIANKDLAETSRQLVLLDDKVKLDVPLADLAVHEPDARKLIAFLKAMEFSTLTRRVAEYSQIDPSDVEADAKNASGASGKSAGSSPPPPRAAEGDLFGDQAPPASANGKGRASAVGKEGKPDRSNVILTPHALAAARAEAARKTPVDRNKYQTIRSLDQLNAWIARVHDVGYFAIEAKANSIDPMQAEMSGIALALAPNDACYVPLAHKASGDGDGLFAAGLAPDQIEAADALESLRPLLESQGILKIGFNIKFNAVMFAQHGITLQNHDDAQLMSYALDAGRNSHALDALSERWLGHAIISHGELTGSGKGKLAFDQVAIDRATAYSAEDADVILRLWQVLKPRLVAERMATVYETLERPLISVLARMERRGISIDRQVLSRLSADFAQTAARVEAEIQEIAGEPVNVGSPKQIGDILFGKMGLPGGTKTKTGAWSTTAQVLDDLAEQGHDLPKKILEWRQVSKLKSTYTDALPTYVHPQTHRVHTTYALAATTTGRLSSNEPNLQNIPVRTEDGRKIRRAFIASPGHKLVSADYSQIELRLLAEIADIPVLKQAFKDGLDIHAMTASEMFGVPIKDMPGEVRRRAKAINFGIIYGISAFGLANQLGIAREEASAYIKKYFERFPGIRAYMDATRDFCRSHGYVETLFGRKCHYPDIKASNASIRSFNERAAINARLQGTAADIIRRAMTRMEDALAEKKLSAQMLLQVHDELIFEVPDNEVAATLPVVQHVMQDAPFPAVVLSVPLHVDARAANNWDEAH
ncbi:DNA polymerase I [Bradyrhizobium sediminis]|uniref:DNA polymerase I n=1 Tax=Bradyrhizobium sediminis TaxID=2840469 RepID=A0A975RMV8_9BRAD|nr:DNA polymerase I [Bradyrhizobium sediminis]QWG12916.1 DNA polymerase I [Bradyrhizobium sediminis]